MSSLRGSLRGSLKHPKKIHTKITPVKYFDLNDFNAESDSYLHNDQPPEAVPKILEYYSTRKKRNLTAIKTYELVRTPSQSERLIDTDTEEVESALVLPVATPVAAGTTAPKDPLSKVKPVHRRVASKPILESSSSSYNRRNYRKTRFRPYL